MAETGNILIVDDNPNNLQVLGSMLGQAGFKVRPALSGEIALRAVEVTIPDLILLDIRMPGMDGYETCKHLKANERTRDVPVIFISAMNDIEDKLTAFKSGGVDYVAKPFQEEEVLARVRAHIQLYRIKRDLEQMVEERTRDLADSEARYRVLFQDSPLAVVVYDTESWHILAVNAACTRILGYSAEEMIGKSVGFAVEPEQHEILRSFTRNLTVHSREAASTGQLSLHHRDGHVLVTEGIVQRIDYAGCRAQILMLQDVTAHRQAEERLRMEAKKHQLELQKSVHFDSLTGLPNRTLFIERMRQGLEQSQMTGRWMAVCCLDLDNFKVIKQSHDKEVVDHLLINLAEGIRSCLRGGDIMARIGNDSFALLLLGIKSDEEINRIIEEILERIAQPFISDTLALTLSASIGVTTYPQDDADAETLLRHADNAMILAKQNSKGHFLRFDPEADRRVWEQKKAIELMRPALENREFVLYYQPKVDLELGKVVGAEALIRWQHPERGLLPPGAFLPAIEGDNFMVEMGDWVISEALSQMSRWREKGLDISVSVNIAALHLSLDGFVDRLRILLEANPGTPAKRLEIEVLESSALDDIEKIEKIIGACRELGIGFSLDDFGTGYSSLTYLRRLSADTVKIDQTFVRNMMENPEDLAIVSGVIGLAKSFKRKVIAEGVETVAHGKALLNVGCVMLQGYGIARPMPADDLPGWVAGWPDEAWLAVIKG